MPSRAKGIIAMPTRYGTGTSTRCRFCVASVLKTVMIKMLGTMESTQTQAKAFCAATTGRHRTVGFLIPVFVFYATTTIGFSITLSTTRYWFYFIKKCYKHVSCEFDREWLMLSFVSWMIRRAPLFCVSSMIGSQIRACSIFIYTS